jgi:tetratricopeptide (TPR) repeat protein
MMRLINSLTRWQRTDWLLLATLGALALGVLLPWYTLPSTTLEAFGTSLWAPAAMRLIPVAAAIAVWRTLRAGVANRRSRTVLWASLGACLLFPFAVTVLSPPVTFISTALDLQRDSVSIHIETNFSDVQSQWKKSIELDRYGELEPYVAEGLALGGRDLLNTLPSGRSFNVDNSQFFQPPSWDRFIVEGLYYAPGFLGAAGWGWPITVFALCAALLAVYLVAPAELYADARRLGPWFAGGVALVAMLVFLPTVVIRQMQIWQTRGQHERAVMAGDWLYACYPPVRGDVVFLTHLIESKAKLGQADPAQLDFAKGVEHWRNSQLDVARIHLEQALKRDDNFLTRGFLSAVYLRLGVQLYERDQPSAAVTMFQQVRDVFPEHIQATYFAMIADAVNADFTASAKMAGELRDMQQYFRIAGIAVLGQTHLHDAWAAYRDGRLDDAWQAYRKSVDREAWE